MHAGTHTDNFLAATDVIFKYIKSPHVTITTRNHNKAYLAAVGKDVPSFIVMPCEREVMTLLRHLIKY